MSIYLSLTRAFNEGALRAILSSGQAVVVHRLALMSKDGDWILRERPEALHHVLEVLQKRGARYRFGAPLDVRWMEGGWSSHFERETRGMPLLEAHEIITQRAAGVLPFRPLESRS